MQALLVFSMLSLLSAVFAGVTIKTLKAGDGINFPQKGQTVIAHYTGTLLDGTKFDSSRAGKPYRFRLGHGEVIRGWDEGLAQMSLGQHSIMTVTSDFAYGAAGVPNVIPPDSTLVFDVELLGYQ